jgi:hypothetical protein
MVGRLLKQLESPRRHLTILVGLLALTFVFTGLLASEARRAELSRQATAQGVLRDMVAGAASGWAFYLEEFTGTSLYSVAKTLILPLVADPELSLSDPADAFERFCPDCSTASEIDAFDFPFDERSGTTAAGPLDATLQQRLRDRSVEGPYALFHAQLRGFLHIEADSTGRPAGYATYLILDPSERPRRIVGFTVPADALQEMLQTSFDMVQVVPATMSDGLPNTSFFTAGLLPAAVEGAVKSPCMCSTASH